MVCIQLKAGRTILYTALAVVSRHKWIKAGTQRVAQKFKRQIEFVESACGVAR